MRFPIVIHKDAGSGYGVVVPDLPGCFSAGDSLDEAIESAGEAIACHVEGLLMDDEAIPARAALETHQGNEDYRDGVWAIVAVDISRLSPARPGGSTSRSRRGFWTSWTGRRCAKDSHVPGSWPRRRSAMSSGGLSLLGQAA